ncbi:hypothetical protein GCM10009836_49520 [Pseudonocardia ailaonensis]|uniref:Cyclic nucleotide-binding domain-containing protein n=1 Tax=Pseudonocardia ailaonensis TaxID=367279 RepID=A0ABN2NEU7_9PSEU
MSVPEVQRTHGLEQLDPEAWAALWPAGRSVGLGRGEAVLSQGGSSDALYLLEEGYVSVTVSTADGAEVFLAFDGPGSVLGGVGFLDHRPRSGTVRATTPVRVRVLSRPVAERVTAARPTVMLALTLLVAARTRALVDRRVRYSQGSLSTRIGRVLVDHARDFGSPSGDGRGVVLDAPLSQPWIADLVGARPRIVGLELARLQAGGLIDTGYRARPRRLRVFDVAALEEFVETDADVARMPHRAG